MHSCPAGALISHDRLLLQVNPERELGDTGYQLGQVSRPALVSAVRPPPGPPAPWREGGCGL